MNYSEKLTVLVAEIIGTSLLTNPIKGIGNAPDKTHRLAINWKNAPEGMDLPSALLVNSIDIDNMMSSVNMTQQNLFFQYLEPSASYQLSTINVEVHTRIAGKQYAKDSGSNKGVPFTVAVSERHPAGSIVHQPQILSARLSDESKAEYSAFVASCAREIMVSDMKSDAAAKATAKAAAKLALAEKLAKQLGITPTTPAVTPPSTTPDADAAAIKAQLLALNEAVTNARGAEKTKAQAVLNDFLANM